MVRRTLAIWALAGTLTTATEAATIRVPLDHPTIQDAIDAAVAGDEVLVADGTYTGASNKNLDYDGKDITVVSENGAAVTIIDCEGSGHGVVLQSGESTAAVLDGFTVTGSVGAVRLLDSSATIRNCTFEGNATTAGGGALFLSTSAAIVTSCTFRGNEATPGRLGGAIYLTQWSTPTFVDCVITGNLADEGGAIYVTNNATATLTACTIAGNRARLDGGGIATSTAGVITLERTILWGNCSDGTNDEIAASATDIYDVVCSDVDATGVDPVDGTFNYDPDTIFTDPIFCAPEPCASAPTTVGAYTIDTESPCTAANAPCGQRMGAMGTACSAAIHVPGDYTTIQEALDAAQSGETVLVADGTYATPLDKNLDFSGKDIVLRSENGASSTTIDCGGSGSGLVFDDGETLAAVVEGFTITGASASGIVCNGSAPTISYCEIRSNDSGSSGGGGIYATAGAALLITDCVIEDNSSLGSTWGGGGLLIEASSTATLSGCTITDNSTGGSSSPGGGMNVRDGASVSVLNSTFADNAGEDAGAIYVSGSSAVALTQCLIVGNCAFAFGGGVLAAGSATFDGCTLAGNGAGTGGGISVQGGTVSIERTIAWGNCAGDPATGEIQILSGGVDVTSSCVDPTGVSGAVNYVASNVFTDPVFCNADRCDLDPCGGTTNIDGYSLKACSPCLPANSPSGELLGARDVGCSTGDVRVPDDFPSIQAALDATCPGDTVFVAAGSYTGPDNTGLDFGGKDLVLASDDGPETTTIRCNTEDSAASAIVWFRGETSAAKVRGFTIRYAEDGGLVCDGASPTIESCHILDNDATSDGGGVRAMSGAAVTITACSIEGNDSAAGGAGVFVDAASSVTVTSSSISDNTSSRDGTGLRVDGVASLVDCAVTGNQGTYPGGGAGGGLYISGSGSADIIGCTIAGNRVFYTERAAWRGSVGGGIAVSGTASIMQSIVWDNTASQTAGDIWAMSGSQVDLTCSVVDPGAVAGSVSYLADNVFDDPMFCDPASCLTDPATACDYRTTANSPTIPTNSPCGTQIGALGIGCADGGVIASEDFANDQGGQVRVRWAAARQDAAGSSIPVTSYSLWRNAEPGMRGVTPAADAAVVGPDVLRGPPGVWDFVGTIPASGESEYSAIIPTVCDSTDIGVCYTRFFVRTHTDVPTVVFDSAPDSAYSVDNLDPGVPGNLRFEGPAVLEWDESEDADFRYFSVYGSSSDVLDESAVLIDRTVTTSLAVAGHAYYHVTATDFAGNEGDAATADSPLHVQGSGAIAAFRMSPSHPNPFRSRTTITLELPVEMPVTLHVFDVSGRLVRTAVARSLPAGRHAIALDARSDGGASIAPGVYYVRARAGTDVAEQRIIMMDGR